MEPSDWKGPEVKEQQTGNDESERQEDEDFANERSKMCIEAVSASFAFDSICGALSSGRYLRKRIGHLVKASTRLHEIQLPS